MPESMRSLAHGSDMKENKEKEGGESAERERDKIHLR